MHLECIVFKIKGIGKPWLLYEDKHEGEGGRKVFFPSLDICP